MPRLSHRNGEKDPEAKGRDSEPDLDTRGKVQRRGALLRRACFVLPFLYCLVLGRATKRVGIWAGTHLKVAVARRPELRR
jgi:hypothetical protein